MPEEISQSNGPVVEASAVSVQRMHSRGVAVEDVNWQVKAGEYWIIGGPHGSGKSSFVITMAGLRVPATGVIRHFGQDLAQLSEHDILAQRLRVGFVFKNGGRMFAQLTVAESVALPLRYHRNWTNDEVNAAVKALLEITELTPLAGSTAQDLATGWQERVGLARALALEPEVLFLDEPMAGLEGGHRRWWRRFLDELCRGAAWAKGRKMTVIAATSDFSYWHGEQCQYALLKDGRWQPLEGRPNAPEINELVKS
ncbi:MAG TPA: ABC transporter ATP-binding protein [Verrucomicrobiae bacterium]|jgi:ABC-type transporter Mla maintaining outer membrane lipid asymmetry ATPase subunit MlaF